ncbi:MAG: hypothetical protein DMD92_19610 [Candidatus Rokuibacteriota bacterium]|nr:MAG: hypothetical protein DMD92_19610 [Candidatus Rokubacteria bacterium]
MGAPHHGRSGGVLSRAGREAPRPARPVRRGARVRRPRGVPLLGARGLHHGHGDQLRRGPVGDGLTTVLALHTWTLDTTPLTDVLRLARRVGWDGVELRRIDFTRAAAQGQAVADVLALVKGAGLPVACVGVELGWMWAEGDERRRLLRVFDEQCERAALLGCATVMSPVDKGRGDLRRAAESVREVGDIAAKHGVRLAVEFNWRRRPTRAAGSCSTPTTSGGAARLSATSRTSASARSPTCSSATCRGAASSPGNSWTGCPRARASCPSASSSRSSTSRATAAS